MPRLSGFEVVEVMRNEMKMNTPVLILSRSHLDDTIHQAYTAGANEFLIKTFEPEELVVKVTRMLAPKRHADE
jgi:DNA-binding response OmpR family regulator